VQRAKRGRSTRAAAHNNSSSSNNSNRSKRRFPPQRLPSLRAGFQIRPRSTSFISDKERAIRFADLTSVGCRGSERRKPKKIDTVKLISSTAHCRVAQGDPRRKIRNDFDESPRRSRETSGRLRFLDDYHVRRGTGMASERTRRSSSTPSSVVRPDRREYRSSRTGSVSHEAQHRCTRGAAVPRRKYGRPKNQFEESTAHSPTRREAGHGITVSCRREGVTLQGSLKEGGNR